MASDTVPKQPPAPWSAGQEPLAVTLVVLFGLSLLMLWIPDFENFPDLFLWAEDGNTFWQGAADDGLWSLVTPYQGYLHVYPRLVALLGSPVSLGHIPIVYFAGWLAAYMFTLSTITLLMLRNGAGLLSCLALGALVTLQPNHEVLFTLTNSQWWLGLSLCLLVLLHQTPEAGFRPGLALATFGLALTGPFSMILVPVLLLRWRMAGRAAVPKSVAVPLVAGALIQLAVFLSSDRGDDRVITTAPWDWVVPFVQLMLFAAGTWLVLLVSVAVWGALATQIKRRPATRQTGLLFIAAIVLFVVASLYSHKDNPAALIPLGFGNRYTFIPVSLALCAVLLLSLKDRILHWAMIAALGMAWGMTFLPMDRKHLFFQSFAAFSTIRTVHIPIQPVVPLYPQWSLSAGDDTDIRPQFSLDNPESLRAALAGANQLVLDISGDAVVLSSTGTDPFANISVPPDICTGAQHIGLEFETASDRDSWVQVFWAFGSPAFREESSFTRWYPEGSNTVQVAFPGSGNGPLFVRLDPMRQTGDTRLSALHVFCL